MNVMNISSPACGFAGELRSPGERTLPSRAWEGGPERGAGSRVSKMQVPGPTPCSCGHPWH